MLRVSVVIPCYNAGAYLREALHSVFTQDHVPHEVIVVDDGSTDSSPDVVREFGNSVRYFRHENQGISITRNRAVSLVEGDVVAFLDADDLWTKDSISMRMAPLLANAAIDCVAGCVRQFISPELSEVEREGMFCPDDIRAARVAGASLIRREVFERVGPFDPSFRLGETIDWVARAEAKGVVFETLDEVVLLRRIHGRNTGVKNRAMRSDYLSVLRASLERRRAASPDASAG